jgi:hypothetical protein
MEALLRKDFTAYYGLNYSTVLNICQSTNATYFEIEDDEHKETKLHFTLGMGMAVYQNKNSLVVTIINYDKFITSLPHAFQHGKKRCDLVIHTNNLQYFLLNELKDRNPKPKVRTKSISQLLSSLQLITQVPAIVAFINMHQIRQCCYFNKQPISPSFINAPAAFGRFNSLVKSGLKMPNADIQSYGFEFWEYSGNQIFNL